MRSRLPLAALSLVLSAHVLLAQSATKPPLTPDDWDRWRSINAPAISDDGRWVVYSLIPQVGDGEMVVRATSGTTEYRVPRGFVGRPQTQPGAQSDSTIAPPPAVLGPGSRFAATLTYPPKREVDQQRRPGQRSARGPIASLAIVDLSNGNVTTVPRVRSFRFARESGRFIAYLLEPEDTTRAGGGQRDSTPRPQLPGEPPPAAATPGAAPRPIADSTRRGRRREYGSTLVLRELSSGAEVRIPDVLTYAFDDSAKWLGYTVSSRTSDRDGAYVRQLGDCTPPACAERALLSGLGEYKQLAFDRRGAQAAFVSNRDESTRPNARYALYYAPLAGAGRASAQLAVAANAVGDSMVVADAGRVEFTRDGSAILFGVAPAPLDSIPADSLADKAVFDLWHYKDPRLQPQQRVDATRQRNRSFGAIYHIAARRMVRLANDSIPDVQVSENGRVGFANTSTPYAIEAMWGEGGNDLYVFDATTGSRRLIRQRLRYPGQLSPAARYVTFFDEGRWFAYGIATGRTVDLTGAIKGIRFDIETWDTPDIPAPWGIAGWTTDDRSVLVYDRYDIWELDPAGARPPRMVTDSVGRREHLIFRLVDLDRDERFIDPTKPLLLRAFDDDTKASGFWRDRLGETRPPERVVMADASFGMPQKARKADQFVVTRGTFVEFPNLHTGPSLDRLTRVSDANPQQREYRWGTVDLVEWLSADGVPLKGLLYKPEDFDPSKKYPMVTYFYERLSNNRHSYIPPAGRNVINPTHYVSNGWLVFEPDIHYETGYPGPSAMKSIIPGVQMLLARGFVDPNGLGIQGQSWGGYQTAYIITQSRLFRAAMAGAPVANMFSAYGGIRWQSGLARAFQYEKSQSRIGGSIWEYPLRFIENSPLFWADKVQTPLLMMHNDNDGAVPWYQGIEMFVALRRLGKEVYLLNYNGDEHNPTKRANQKDVAIRMEQFFNHHLRGHPRPAWMEKGIPYRMKGREQIVTTPPQPVPVGGQGQEGGGGAERRGAAPPRIEPRQ